MFKQRNDNKSTRKRKHLEPFDYKYEENKSFIINQLENIINPVFGKVEELLKLRIFSNLRDTKGREILRTACQNPYVTIEIFQSLIANGNPVEGFEEVINDEELTMPFSIADKLLNDLCRYDNINFDLIKLLVEKYKANPNAIIAGSNSLYCICSQNEVTLEIIKYLIKNGADPSPAAELLKHLCYNDNANLEIIKYFVEELKVDLDKRDMRGKNLFDWVCDSETVTSEILKYLIEKGANIEEHVIYDNDYEDVKYTAVSPVTDLLHYLCYKDNVDLELIKFLVEECGADVNAYVFGGKNFLYWVCDTSTVTLEVIKYVIGKSADKEQHASDESDQEEQASFSTATDLLHRTCNNGNVDLEIIKYFVETHKADIKGTVDKRNLLHWACASKTVTLAVIKYLVENEVDLKQDDLAEDSPVHLFFKKYLKNDVFMVDKEIIHYLLDQDIDVDAIDGQQQTILHLMIESKEMDLLAIYKVIEKSKRSSLTLIDEDFDRPLEAAYRSNNQDALILLLLLRWGDVGLDIFEPGQYENQQPDESDSNPGAFYEKRQTMRQLVNAAQKSKKAFEEELDRAGYLDKFPDECLRKLALDGCLSEQQLRKLKKERNIFVKENVQYFPESTKNKIFTFFCDMKVTNKNNRNKVIDDKARTLRLSFPIPQLVQHQIMREILYNDAQAIRKEKVEAEENNNITIGLRN